MQHWCGRDPHLHKRVLYCSSLCWSQRHQRSWWRRLCHCPVSSCLKPRPQQGPVQVCFVRNWSLKKHCLIIVWLEVVHIWWISPSLLWSDHQLTEFCVLPVAHTMKKLGKYLSLDPFLPLFRIHLVDHCHFSKCTFKGENTVKERHRE